MHKMVSLERNKPTIPIDTILTTTVFAYILRKFYFMDINYFESIQQLNNLRGLESIKTLALDGYKL